MAILLKVSSFCDIIFNDLIRKAFTKVRNAVMMKLYCEAVRAGTESVFSYSFCAVNRNNRQFYISMER